MRSCFSNLVDESPRESKKLALGNIKIRGYISKKKISFMKCKNCAKDLLDPRQKFCSINCQDDYVKNLEKIIEENEEAPKFSSLTSSPDIYIPIIAFIILVIITITLRKFFYKK